MPNLAIKKTTIPKEGLNKLIFIPEAKTPVETSFVAAMASIPLIIPIKCPKKPQTKANKPIEFMSFCNLLFSSPFTKPKKVRMIQVINSSKVGYIKNGPPSLNRFENKGFTNSVVKKYVIFIVFNIIISSKIFLKGL